MLSDRLSAQQARRICDAALAQARSEGVFLSVVVTDPGGAPIAMERMDGATPASADIALAKARTSAAFCIATSMMEAGIRSMPGLATVPNIVAAGGGVPIMQDGRCRGAVGASGGSAEQDEAAALAGIEAAG